MKISNSKVTWNQACVDSPLAVATPLLYPRTSPLLNCPQVFRALNFKIHTTQDTPARREEDGPKVKATNNWWNIESLFQFIVRPLFEELRGF